VVGIHAIGGMAGVGKTAFAVHAAHRFPGGQIFLPLHGHTPGQQPVDPADALASLVLVTSRRHLSALDDAAAVSLDTLPPGEAAALLVRLAGRAGLIPGDPAVAELTGLCGFLPLAIGMVARQLHHHPAWSAAGRAAELASARDRLELMATESLSVAAAFDLSYADLTEDQQRLFRRLGLHPGTDIDRYAAAALDDADLAAARRGLETLYDQYLLTEPAAGRYRMHDLIREHARALAGRLDPDRDRDGAATTSAAGSARPTPSSTSGPCGERRVSTRLRPGSWSRPWASTATSVTGVARPRRSTREGRCTGSAVTSRKLRGVTSGPWTWPAPSPVPGTRRTRWPAWVAAPWPPATPPRPRSSCGRH
jgi:hypothetical protein